MSGFISEPERSHEQHLDNAKSSHGDSGGSKGQAHDRMAGKPSKGSTVMLEEQYDQATEMDISAGQKMLSAVSGSLFTSLLGIYIPRSLLGTWLICPPLVTPLDVVRVRLQSHPSIA